MNDMNEKARKFCSLTDLTFLAVSGDGWLDTKEQLDLSPDVWLPILRLLQ